MVSSEISPTKLPKSPEMFQKESPVNFSQDAKSPEKSLEKSYQYLTNQMRNVIEQKEDVSSQKEIRSPSIYKNLDTIQDENLEGSKAKVPKLSEHDSTVKSSLNEIKKKTISKKKVVFNPFKFASNKSLTDETKKFDSNKKEAVITNISENTQLAQVHDTSQFSNLVQKSNFINNEFIPSEKSEEISVNNNDDEDLLKEKSIEINENFDEPKEVENEMKEIEALASSFSPFGDNYESNDILPTVNSNPDESNFINKEFIYPIEKMEEISVINNEEKENSKGLCENLENFKKSGSNDSNTPLKNYETEPPIKEKIIENHIKEKFIENFDEKIEKNQNEEKEKTTSWYNDLSKESNRWV